jgi:hypothetical protein
MVDKEFIAYFKIVHGFFNLSMLALFCYQSWMGFLIRQARQAGAPVPLDAVRRHRKAGPVFALWGVLGFVAGPSRCASARSTLSRAGFGGPSRTFVAPTSAWACSCWPCMSSRSYWASASCSDQDSGPHDMVRGQP